MFSHRGVFADVRVDPDLGQIRVSCLVGTISNAVWHATGIWPTRFPSHAETVVEPMSSNVNEAFPISYPQRTNQQKATNMRANALRQIRASGGAAVNGWLPVPSAFSAETMAHQGWHSLTIDLQYGVVDYQAAVNMLTAISTTDTVPVTRMPWLDPVNVGPSDLSLALGCTLTFDDVDPPAAEAIEMIVAKAREHGKIGGIHNGSSTAALKRIDMGFQFVTISSEARIIAAGSQQILSEMRIGSSARGLSGY